MEDKTKRQRNIKIHYTPLGILLFLLLGIGTIIFLYRYYTHTDIASILLQQTIASGSKTKLVTPISHIHHVFVIVEENRDWQSIYHNPDAPFINKTLLPMSAYTQQYYNVPKTIAALHPSEPNYIFLESGMIAFPDQTFTTDDNPSAHNSTNSDLHIVYLLQQKGLTWKSYQEDISGEDCPISIVKNYAPKHNPFVYFQDVSGNPPSSANTSCRQHIRPFSELQKDLQTGNVANYTFITPNLQNDMHTGTVAQGDEWLSDVVPMIVHSSTFQKDGALFITWDEGDEGDDKNNPIGMIVTSPFIKQGYTDSIAYSHASFVKTVEEIFQLSPLLGMAGNQQTQDLSNLFQNVQ